jgi:uncharacterized protein YceH (UPF0502 family)
MARHQKSKRDPVVEYDATEVFGILHGLEDQLRRMGAPVAALAIK